MNFRIKYKFATLSAAILVLPNIVYFFFNFYWWLFDGNIPIESKMWASGMGIIVGGMITLCVGLAEE